MTDRRAALLNAIFAEPKCDTARLVYADYIQEHGSEDDAYRAEFIREHIAHRPGAEIVLGVSDLRNGMGAPITGSKYATASGTKKDLWELAGLATCCRDWVWMEPGRVCSITYVRGFIATVRGPLDLVRERLPAIVRDHPVERVEVTDRRPFQFAPNRHLWHNADHRLASGNSDPDHLPAVVFDRMVGHTNSGMPTALVKRYTSRESAVSAFEAVASDALLAEAREKNEAAVCNPA